ncbi:hypothetical protein AB8Z38_27770 [Bradyrhizobium sp. LLZ17]|uniref:Uncharacterized protein n=1 Tax=Bradyrhizobium sp. LLZ17 TaxID=3239388 RepID=A0AB39XH02_9BRAD
MSNFTKYVGGSIVVDSGVAVLGPDDNYLSIDIRGLKFSIGSANDRSLGAITIKSIARDHVMITINVWQGGDLTFKFQVGTISDRVMDLAVHLDVHTNHRVITYTFSQRGA